MFDLKIVNGSIISGAKGEKSWLGCVAVKNGRIAALGKDISGAAQATLDARGHVVCPGFIDLHTHCAPKHNLNYLQAGVTTVVSGNCGFGRPPADLPKCVAGRCGPNIAYLSGHNSVRLEVMSNVNRAPTPAELERMAKLMAADMAVGAMGFSAGLEYVPGHYAETPELIHLAKVAADYGGIYTVHMRNEGDGLLEAVRETLRIGEEGGLPAHISHIKVVGVNNFGRAQEVLALLDAARRRGLDVTQDQYPYPACCGRILLLLSQWMQEGTSAQLRARIEDPATRARAKAELTEKLERVYGGDATRVVVATAPDTALVGRSLGEIAEMRGRASRRPADVADVVLDVVQQFPEQTAVYCVFHSMAEEDVQCFLRHPFTAVASDGWSVKFGEGQAHPRHYGTCPRVLGHYARDEKLFPLEEAVRRMTSMPAARLGLTDRGMLAEGVWADLVVFDPATIKDMATFEKPHQYAEGIAWVIVNGDVVVDHGKATDRLPGVYIPRPAKPARKGTSNRAFGALVEPVVFPGKEWERRTPQELGLNTNAIAQIGDRMKEARANGALIYKGYLVAEWTFDGPSTQQFEVQSVSKSITSMVLGLALQEGLIPDLDANVKEYYPDFDRGTYTDEITFRHLVTATSGIKTTGNFAIYNALTVVKPGTESRYHNDHTLELGKALTYVFGEDLEKVLRTHVLSRIGADMHWGAQGDITVADGRKVRLVSGYYLTHWTAQDLARVGWLYANGGKWNGIQLLPAEYVAESMTPIPEPVKEYRAESRYRLTNTDGLPYDPQRNRPGLAYGLSWWASKKMVDGKEKWMWAMGGNYGQQCMVWPERGLVLVKVNTPRKPPFISSAQLWPLLINCACNGPDHALRPDEKTVNKTEKKGIEQ